MAGFPYEDQFEVHRSLPEEGTNRDVVLSMLSTMSQTENPSWETGQCSGTMYCGDHEHYDYLNEAFSYFSYVNSLQRDLCPSATKFEAEIVAMTLDLLGARALRDSTPVGLVTSGGSSSIAHAVLAYREHHPTSGRPNIIKPETAHPAFNKAGHLFGVEIRVAPVDPLTTLVDLAWVREHVDANTVALVGSACNYGYGTIDPIGELGALALEYGVGLHVDGCLGGFILPFGRELGYDIEPFDFSVPGVTSISADTHKYGYSLKGTSVLSFADKALRNDQYFYLTDWSGGKYCSPGMDGSRSAGLLAATWAAMVHLGRSGYRHYAKQIFETSAAMQDAVREHPSLHLLGKPSFLFSFAADDYDVYLVNDFLRTKGWRLNGQQYPNALHMAVTRPQTRPGVADRWRADLADAVDYAVAHRDESARSGAIYGGVAGGATEESDAITKFFMADMMDKQILDPRLMSSRELCLSVDLGTGGPKIGLVTLDGEVLVSEVHHVTTHFSDDGAATQDAKQWWALILEASGRLLTLTTPGRVRAVAVTGQYASTVPVDANGEPTGPCLTWLDTRGGRFSRPAIGGSFQGYNARKALSFIRKTGGAPSPSGADPVGQMLYLTNEEPEVTAATRWFMEPVDYLTMRFCGAASATHASRLAMWMTDVRHLDHYDYDDRLLAMVGLERTRLPPLVPFGSIVGTVKQSVASQLGLSNDVVVVSGIPDLHAAAIGAGATKLYDTHLALSTTSWISCPVPTKKTDVKHSIASVPGLTNDSYVMINSQDTGAKALEWLRGVLQGAGTRVSFDEMTALAASAPPGSNGVLFTPWLAGERSPVGNKFIRAGFSNVALTTSTADLIRAVMEGVAANSAWLFGYVEKFVGRELSPIRLLGGGAQSSLWCQIYANTLDRDVEQVTAPLLAQLRGAALLASVALGQRSLDDVGNPVPGEVFRSDANLVEGYRARAALVPGLYARDKKWAKRARR